MTAYKTEVTVTEQIIVDAADKLEAEQEAIKEAQRLFDVEDFQVNVAYVKELN